MEQTTIIRNQIIADLYQCKRFNNAINSFEPQHLREDLKSEVVLELMNQPVDRLQQMNGRGELLYFAIRIAKNFLVGGHSKFNRTYRKSFVEFEGDITIDQPIQPNDHEAPILDMLLRIKVLAHQDNPDYILDLFGSVNWYRQYMISLYMKLGNYELMVEETGIPKFSCFMAVKEGLEGLQKHFGLPTSKQSNKRLSIKKCLQPALAS